MRDLWKYADSIIATVREPMLVLDQHLRVDRANQAFYRDFHLTQDKTVGHLIFEMGDGQWNIPSLRSLLEDILSYEDSIEDFEVLHHFEFIGTRMLLLNARRVASDSGDSSLILLAIEDVTERRRLGNELQQLNTRFNSMVKNVRDHSSFTIDLDGHISSWNQEAERILGFTEDEALGQHFSIIFTPADIAGGVPQQELETALRQGRADDERWHLRKSGEQFWAFGVVTPTYDLSGRHTGFSKILRDMTERKRTEDLLVSTLESITDGFARFDQEWRFVYVNAEAERINRLPRAEMLGRSMWDVFPAVIGTTLDVEMRRAMTDRITVEFENYYEPFGRWYSLKCFPTTDGGLTTYIRDITDVKLAAEELQKSEARFRAGIEAVSTIFWTNDPLGRMTGEQVGWSKFTGQDYASYQGHGWTDALHPDDAQPTLEAWTKAISTKQNFVFEHRVRRHDGQWRLCTIRAVPVFTSQGAISEWVGVHTDITEQRRAEALLAGQKNVLELVTADVPLSDVLTAICHLIETQEHDLVSTVVLADQHGQNIALAVGGQVPETYLRGLAGLSLGEPYIGSCGEALHRGEMVAVSDVESDVRYCQAWRDHLLSHGLRTCQSVPVISSKGMVLASFAFYRKDTVGPTAVDTRLIEVATNLTAIAVEQRRAEQDVRAALHDTQLLYRLTMDLAKPGTPQELYERLLDAAVEIMHADFASLQVLHPYRGIPDSLGDLELVAYRGFPPEVAKYWAWVSSNSESPYGVALRTGERCDIRDSLKSSRVAGDDLDPFVQSGIRAVQATPLLSSDGRVIGVIATHWKAPRDPQTISDRDWRMLDVLSQHAADLVARNQAAEQIRKSESRLRQVFESNVVGMIRWDLDRSLILDANDKFLQMTGYRRDDLIAGRLNFREMTPPEWTARNEEGIRTIRETGCADSYEKEYFRKDGSRVPIFIAGTRFDDSPSEGMSLIIDLSERKSIEAEIARLAAEADRQKRLYETVLTNTPDFMYVFSLDHKVIYANDSLIRMWGRGYEGAIGKTFLEIGYEPWHAEMHDREIDQVRATRQPVRGEVPFNGTLGRRQYDYIFVPVFGADGEVEAVAGTTRDVTDRKEYEERLRQSESRLAGIFQQAPIFMCVLRGEQHVFEMANDRFYSLVGERDLIGMPVREALPEVVSQGYVELLDKVYQTGEPYVGTGKGVLLQSVGQRYIDFVNQAIRNADGSVSGVLVAGVDLTARYQAEAALRASEERAAFVRRSSGVGMWYCDLPFDVLEWDDLVKTHFQLPADAVVSIQTFYDRLHPDDREPTRLAIEQSIRERTAYSVEYRTVDADTGNIKWVRAIGRTSYAADGTPQRFDGVTLDITEQKRAEQEREVLVAQLREADRQKDEFLATLAHELRNPLAPIRNGLQVMKLSAGSLEDLEGLREMMERQVNQMAHLIDDLMDLSRISRGKISLQKQILNIADSIRDAIDASRPLINSHAHELACELPSEAVYVEADPTRLAQVISNILNNAAKYTERGGRIRLSARREADEVVITIEDNGVGIPEAMLPKVFDMFTQVDRSLEKSHGGLGIGLNIVSRLVKMHGGSVEAQSDGQDMGSRFVIRLPVSTVLATATMPVKNRHSEFSASRRILVVDDNVDGARSLAMMLQFTGNEVQVAHDGLQALSVAESFRPDVILMDIGMPKLNGYETCRRLRLEPWGRDIVIVAQTGWGTEDDQVKSHQAGFNFHMVKPIDPASLQRVLDAIDARDTSLKNLRVLAVDDRRDAIFVLGKLLKIVGCDVRTATDGESALQIVKEFIPEVIFLDIEMPGMSGIEMANIIRHDEALKSVALIAMTGHDSVEDKQRFRDAGFDAHLVKPADIRDIKQVLKTYSRSHT